LKIQHSRFYLGDLCVLCGKLILSYIIREGLVLIVQKYGGTSVGNPERIKNVAKRVVRTKEQGHDVVVVVSAMSGETDKLINLASQVSDNPDPREMDMLLSTGERVTIALLALAIQSLGHKAQSFTGRRASYRTASTPKRASRRSPASG
jgi:aspartate kinase